MGDCIFCDIVHGDAPADIVARWPGAVAFHPLYPVVEGGHILVVPTVHVADALEDPTVTGMVFQRAAEIANGPGRWDCNLITSAGVAATQTVMHLHVHVVRREAGDKLNLPWTAQQVKPDRYLVNDSVYTPRGPARVLEDDGETVRVANDGVWTEQRADVHPDRRR